MKLIICLDEKNKYGFFNKRQSSDEEVLKAIKNIVQTSTLYITEYTHKLFKQYDFLSDLNIEVSSTDRWPRDDEAFCFIETGDIQDKFPEEIYIFNWNRNYPSSNEFDISLSDYSLVSSETIIGKSHPEIIALHYIRKVPEFIYEEK